LRDVTDGKFRVTPGDHIDHMVENPDLAVKNGFKTKIFQAQI